MCKSDEKGRQGNDDETEGRHGRFSNGDGKIEGVTKQERVCKELTVVKWKMVDEMRSLEIPTSTIEGLDETSQ